MNKVLKAISAALICFASYAQGTVRFDTRIPGIVDAPVYCCNFGGPGAGPIFSADLRI